MTDESDVQIISVAGAHSGAGKTTLCSILLEHFTGFGAIKYTKTRLYTSVIDDHDEILHKDKDTAILARSGAARVIWIKSPAGGVADALPLALDKLRDLKGVITEGNSLADVLHPRVLVFIELPGGEGKPSASRTRKKAHIVVINSGRGGHGRPVRDLTGSSTPETFYIDLKERTGEIEEFLACVEKKLGKKVH